ncbi:MAG TPA: hypothetical protein VK918_07135 [Pyrinomonadaceae bacterium]|nr:hypothetical protein [Pyrinomonadaceae bacterium]
MEKKTNKEGGFDKPIQKPFDELPEWFMRNLRSRLVTKKIRKNPNVNDPNDNRKYQVARSEAH